VRQARIVQGVLARDVRRRPWSSVASIGAVAAGVGVFVAIWLAGSAARSSFVDTVDAIAGRATHELTRPGGLPDERFAEIAIAPGVTSAQPIVSGLVEPLSIEASPLLLLGLDPFLAGPFYRVEDDARMVESGDVDRFVTEPGTVILPRPWADEAGVGAGDRLTVGAAGRRVELEVLAVYELDVLGEASRDTALADIATAQEVLGRVGRVDRIDLVLESDEAARSFRGALAPGERLERPSQRGDRVVRMIEAFRLNLVALGGLALVVGSLLVFTASQFAVARRARMLGQLRCLGVSRRAMFLGGLAEAAWLGALGGLAGLGLGVLLAGGLVGSVARTVSDLYAFVRADVASLDVVTAGVVLVSAVALAVAAGFFPALDAARTPPSRVGLETREAGRARIAVRRLLFVAAVAAVVGAIAVLLPSKSFWPGFVAALAWLVAGASSLPVVMHVALPRIRRVAESRGATGLALAAGALERSLHRAGGSAAALGVALAMTVGVLVMIGSFEREVRAWVGSVLRADLFVSEETGDRALMRTRVPDAAVDAIRAHPGVASVETRRQIEVPWRDGVLFALGVDYRRPEEDIPALDRISGGVDGEVVGGFLAGGAIVSEPLARKHYLEPGDSIAFEGRDGPVVWPVVAVFRDYARDSGVALVSDDTLRGALGDVPVSSLAIRVEAGADPERVGASLRASLADRYLLRLRSNDSLRAEVLAIFDRTFRVTRVLQVIATVMALLGIAVTLVSLFLERSREIATLRALGMPATGVVRLFARESLLLAAFPAALAIPLGALLAWVLVAVVNLRSFGWSIRYSWPTGSVFATLALAFGAALVAVLVPRAMTRRQSIAQALREE